MTGLPSYALVIHPASSPRERRARLLLRFEWRNMTMGTGYHPDWESSIYFANRDIRC